MKKNQATQGHQYGCYTGDLAAIAATQKANEMLSTISTWCWQWSGRLAIVSFLILAIPPLFQPEQSASPNRGDGRNTSTIITEN